MNREKGHCYRHLSAPICFPNRMNSPSIIPTTATIPNVQSHLGRMCVSVIPVQ